ncbi:MAG: hypothetical protein K0M40_21685, partial [Prolixibacteraceae bacterium]|nr:hypothetical protein [Prolixibacteraceae bacterium]
MKNLYPLLKFYIFLLLLPTAAFAINTNTTVHLKHENFEVSYNENGVRFAPKIGPIEWKWQLNNITGIGNIHTGNAVPSVSGKNVEYHRGNITEQYLFRGTSIEQQFIVHSEADITGDLVIDGTISSDGQFSKVENGWIWTEGKAKVFLGDVYVFDANGKQIAASMEVTENSTRITVSSVALKNAKYPVTIDPQIGPDDFVLANNATRLYQPRLVYNSNEQKFFSSWTNYGLFNPGRKENIYGASFNLAQIKNQHSTVDQPSNYSNFNISGTEPTGSAANSSATSSDVAYSNSNYLAVWEDFEGPAYSNRKVKYQLNTNAGTSGIPLQVFESSEYVTAYKWPEKPAVAGNNQKYLITAATGFPSTSYFVFGKYITNAGVAESASDITLFSSAIPFTDTEVDALPDGSFFAAAATLNTLYFGVAPASGSMSQNSLPVSGNIGSIALAAGSTQSLLVWSEVASTKYIIKGLWITSAGTASGGAFQIDSDSFFGSGFPSVAYNPDTDSWLVAWHSSPINSAGTMIFGREILNSGNMNDVFPISNQARTSVTPTVAYDSANEEFWIAWSGGGNKDQLLAQRWKNSLSDCIISMKQDTIRENNFKKTALNPSTDILVTTLFAKTAAGDSIYPVDFIPEITTDFQTSYSASLIDLVKPTGTLSSFHASRNKLFYVLNDSINYEVQKQYDFSVYAQPETGVAGKSTSQAKTVRVVDVNEQFYASVPATISFLEDAVDPFIPFTFNSGDNRRERNSVDLSVTATPAIFSTAPTLAVNPSVSTDGIGDGIPRSQVNVSDNVLISLNPNVSGTGDLKIKLTDLKGGEWSSIQKDNTADFTIAVTVTPVNDAPTFTAGSNLSVNEDAPAHTASGWATNINAGAPDESAQVLNFTVSNDNNSLFSSQPAISATGDLTFTPAANAHGSATVTVSLNDNGGTDNGGVDVSPVQTFTITVNPVNDAPTFTAGANPTISEDAGAQTVIGWATAISRGPANESTQVLTFTVTNDNSTLFDTQPDVDETTGTLTYTPKANAFGTATVTVTLSDDGGTANGGTDNSVKTFTITINPINDAPLFTKGADQTVLEDAGGQTVTAWATGISAGNSFESSQVLSFIVTNDNNSLFAVQPSINAATGNLTYTPASNEFGSATITVRLEDDGGTANGDVNTTSVTTFTINVTSVNDAPYFVPGLNPTVLEDSGAKTISGWASGINSGPTNESSQSLTFQIIVTDPALFSVQPSVDPITGDLSFTPANNAFGSTNIEITLSDNGGTASGGVNFITLNAAIQITSVNDKPSFTAGTNQSVLQGVGAQTVSGWATNISPGAANEVDQSLLFSLTNDNTDLFLVQPAIDATTGTLTYTPKLSADGTANISLQLNDDGGTANGGVDANDVVNFTISVVPVNSAPSFTAGANITVNEDAGSQSVIWATDISAGPSYESGQTLTFTVTNDNNSLFSTQPSIDATGNLTYTPASNVFGSTTVTVILKDDGGTANGGVDSSPAETFTITVTSVNDVPTFIAGSDQTVLEDAGSQTVTAWATAISSGPANESGQTLAFTVTNDNNSLFSTQPAIDATGKLTYTPASNVFGSATVTVILNDDGGTANGGVDSSP